MNDLKILFKKLHKDAIVPVYKLHGDAGCDLSSIEDVTLNPGDIKLVGTGIAIQIPNVSIEAQIRPRGGLAFKNGITVLNTPGTVDSGFRGEIKMILINCGKEKFTIRKGDRIAQMVFAHVYKGHFVEVEELEDTERGSGALGHTGI